jgi:hypothetical protein
MVMEEYCEDDEVRRCQEALGFSMVQRRFGTFVAENL